MKKVPIGRDALAALAAITLAGCGGGATTPVTGGSTGTTSPTPAPAPPPAPAPAPTAEGAYMGRTSNLRNFVGIVLDTGAYWLLYLTVANPNIIAGGVQGSGVSSAGTFSSTDARDFNLEGQGVNNATVAASFVAKQSINGSVTYTSLPTTLAFTATYDSSFDASPSVAAIAGTYTGNAAVAGTIETTTTTVTTAGVLTGRGTSGCTFTGVVVPHTHGNVYDVSVTFGGGVCSNGTNTVTGVAFFDAGSSRLYSAAVNATRTNGFIFSGLKGP